MSAINNLNMQDTVVKSSLVQSVQERDVDVSRAHNLASEAFQEEVTRRAEEMVKTVMQPEQEGIRQENSGHGGGGYRGKRRKKEEEPGEKKNGGWRMGADNDGEVHAVNIVV